MSDHADATGIRGDRATDSSRSTRSNIDGIFQPEFPSGILNCLKWSTGPSRKAEIVRVHRYDAAHPIRRKRYATGDRHRAAGKTSKAALRDDRELVLIAQTHRSNEFVRVFWSNHR
jgi:hypothetical protein